MDAQSEQILLVCAVFPEDCERRGIAFTKSAPRSVLAPANKLVVPATSPVIIVNVTVVVIVAVAAMMIVAASLQPNDTRLYCAVIQRKQNRIAAGL